MVDSSVRPARDSTTPGSSSPPAPTSRRGRTISRLKASSRVDVADKPLTQSPIADEAYGSVIVFRDPDNIQLELFCPPGT